MTPEPMTPLECDLRGLPFMPLDAVRLLDSDLFAISTGDEFKAAVALWCKAWLQQPAASLPDDERVLAHLSGAGARWPKVRAMALRGWVRCADGRLYHPVVAEKAREAWERRLAHRARTEAARAAKQALKHIAGGGTPPPVTSAPTRHATTSVTDNAADDVAASKGQGQGQGQGQGEEETPPPASRVSPPRPDARGSRLPDDWKPEAPERAFAAEHGLDAAAVAARFGDYWRAKPGAAGRKLDWPATWRNWCRREAERAPAIAAPRPRDDAHSRRTAHFDALVRDSGITPADLGFLPARSTLQ